MKIYDDKHIKNIVLLGGTKSGKTTLAETMLFEAGLINRRGSVEDKNTTSDWHEIEHERGNSVYASAMHTEWRDFKINIIDTPGLDDLIGEVVPSIRVADTCVMLLNAQHGVEVGTELIWNYVKRYDKPIILAVNQLDHNFANWEDTLASAKASFGNAVTVMQYPVNAGVGFNRIIDLLKMKMYEFGPEGGKPTKHDIPAVELEKANALHNELVEKAAENDEALMELFFEKGTLNEDEMRAGLKAGMLKQDVFPVFCLSAVNNMGSGRMMGFIDNVAPSATEILHEEDENGNEIKCDPSSDPVIFVYKTLIERTGNITFFKVMSGTVKEGMDLENSANGNGERLGQLFVMEGKERKQVSQLNAGDLGAVLKLKDTKTGDTLCAKGKGIKLHDIRYPGPRIRMVIKAADPAHEEKMHEALHEIEKEDPTIEMKYAREQQQQIIYGQGELHLNLLKWKLEHLHHIPIEFSSPRIPYRETIRRSAQASYRHKKQSGGAGQFGEVYMKIEPYQEGLPDPNEFSVRGKEEINLPWGGKLIFFNCIVGGVIDARYIPSILKGVMENMENGPLTGSAVRDIRVMVYDGKMHPVDSNDISFKIAGAHAFKEAFVTANPQILEPVQTIEVRVPEEFMGDVMTDLQGRRSMILGMESTGGYQMIKAHTPLVELDRYSTTLRSLTQGRGSYTQEFHDHVAVPHELQKQLIEAHKQQAVMA